MWADRPLACSRQELVQRLRGILPPPRHGAPNQRRPLPGDRDAAAVAETLWEQPGFIWLDRPGQALIASDPLARLIVRGGRASVHGPCGTLEAEIRGFDLLEAALDAWGGPSEALFCGYLGYDLGLELEGLVRPESRADELPDLYLGLYDWRIELGAEGWQVCGTDAWRSGNARRLPVEERRIPQILKTRAAVTSEPTPEGYRAAVARTVQRIWEGELFQVNLCRRLEALLASSEIWPFYLRLRNITPASQGALIRTGPESAVLSASPELFLSLRQGQVRSCPIKGTRPRGKTATEDRALAAELVASAKDRAELAMIVDVTRNDLGRVCCPGSVAVARHAELVTLPTVHHTFSEVTGRLRPECGPADLLRASFPPASITGAPKIHAMEVATLEEGYRRGPAMGSTGWISLDGDMELSVAIRTAVGSGERIWYLAGCGITAESLPQEELAESQAKAAAFLQALGAVQPESRQE
jgi:para-aminobenzoate synthetase component I